jgi:excisionase family DNA binding protein
VLEETGEGPLWLKQSLYEYAGMQTKPRKPRVRQDVPTWRRVHPMRNGNIGEEDVIAALAWVEWAAKTLRTAMVEERRAAYNKRHGVVEEPPSPSTNGSERLPEVLKVREAAKLAGVSPAKMYDLVNRGEIKSIAIGSRRLIRTETIRAYLLENEA